MALIDAFKTLAERTQPLRYVAVAAVAFFLILAAWVVLGEGAERYLIPSVVGLLWSLSAYAFIATFRFVPRPAASGESRLARLRRRLRRAWFWLLALVCAGSTVAVILVSFRLASIWWQRSG